MQPNIFAVRSLTSVLAVKVPFMSPYSTDTWCRKRLSQHQMSKRHAPGPQQIAPGRARRRRGPGAALEAKICSAERSPPALTAAPPAACSPCGCSRGAAAAGGRSALSPAAGCGSPRLPRCRTALCRYLANPHWKVWRCPITAHECRSTHVSIPLSFPILTTGITNITHSCAAFLHRAILRCSLFCRMLAFALHSRVV